MQPDSRTVSLSQISTDHAIQDVPTLPWYAVKVRAGAEPRIALALEHKGFPIFLPTWTEPRPYSDRIKRVQSALFPGYLFSRLDTEHPLRLVTTPGVDCIVSMAGTPTPIDQSEIDAIIRVTQSGACLEPWPYLKTGDKVAIQFGALSGLEGVLVHSRSRDRLILSVHLLQRSLSVEIDRSWVRPLAVASLARGRQF